MAEGPIQRLKPTGRHWLPCPILEHGTWKPWHWWHATLAQTIQVWQKLDDTSKPSIDVNASAQHKLNYLTLTLISWASWHKYVIYAVQHNPKFDCNRQAIQEIWGPKVSSHPMIQPRQWPWPWPSNTNQFIFDINYTINQSLVKFRLQAFKTFC